MTVVASASPSLALIKYWGKLPGGVNLPATSSLAVTLDGLRTTTSVTENDEDRVVVGGRVQAIGAYDPLLAAVRRRCGSSRRVLVESSNTFPTAAGVASSSSGFAALALALDRFYETHMSDTALSSLARLGSGSASRAVFGGFTTWERGSEYARRVHDAAHWDALRVIVVVVRPGTKRISSRAGMNAASETSPVYRAWIDESARLFARGVDALGRRDLEALGTAMRESYLLMFSTMFTTRPPIIYWEPGSLAVIREAERMRADALPVWETMDAGPQVKLLTLEQHVPAVTERVLAVVPDADLLVARPGGEPDAGVDRA